MVIVFVIVVQFVFWEVFVGFVFLFVVLKNSCSGIFGLEENVEDKKGLNKFCFGEYFV